MAVATTNMTGPASGCVHINGVDYKPAGGVYAIPTTLVPQAEACGLVVSKAVSVSRLPTVADIPAGTSLLWKDTAGGTVKLYYNDGGALKSVALV
jgi:hypothetical protein